MKLENQQQHDTASSSQTPPPGPSQHSSNWSVTVHPTRHGLQLNASVHGLSDLIHLVAPILPRSTPSNLIHPWINVTYSRLPAESSLVKVFARLPATASLPTSPSSSTSPSATVSSPFSSPSNPSSPASHTGHGFDDGQDVANHGMPPHLLMHLIDAFLTCTRGTAPVVLSYYQPYLYQHLQSSMALAIATYTTLAMCAHVDTKLYPDTRTNCGKRLFAAAQHQLRDDLFEQGPNVETACALFLMTQAAMLLLRNHDARLYIHLAWKMVIVLRDDHQPILSQHSRKNTQPHDRPHPQQESFLGTVSPPCTPQPPVPPSSPLLTATPAKLAIAETWRRLYYGVHYLLVHLRRIQEDNVDMASLKGCASAIGYPEPLPCEHGPQQAKAEWFRHFARLHECFMTFRTSTDRLFGMKGTNKVRVADVSMVEHQLLSFWHQLPDHYRLNDHPLNELTDLQVAACQHNHALFLNSVYYVQWLTLACRFLQLTPSDSLTMENMDGKRASLIASRCCHAMALICQCLFQRAPCMLELHWLLITMNATQILQRTNHPQLSSRAGHNLKIFYPIIQSMIRQTTARQPSSSLHQLHLLPTSPSSPLSSASTCSTPSSSSSASVSLSITSTDLHDTLDSPASISSTEDVTGTVPPLDPNHAMDTASPDTHSSTSESPSSVYFNEVEKTLSSLPML
ncbi:hypothetical protein DM01DRAFT_1336683 [Hesseltinella vesiculosa]|uniref:Transcription factor domain-containing protein n=1 Tax=Hesseltinella vesiculosa TaxID=101127 RepID=A0A1X2GEX6_9FUNG|nr:hypothetical protein DM01DRAFT_1336683 [Hesseltinella vesiculosa]